MRGLDRSRDGWCDVLVGSGVQAELAEKLAEYLVLLARWGGAVDLFAGKDPEGLITMLVGESLAALPWMGQARTLVDVGSGNGFPAVPLLLARPGVRGVLLEPRERRWAFLKEVVRELGLAADVRRERAADHKGGYDVATVRGVEVEVWLPLRSRLVRVDGTWLWWTSKAKAARGRGRAADGRMLTFPLPDPSRGVLAVWRRCST
jgi:16S rRNA (guanine(527)-N(7))-methyltransferase RsmG